MILLSCVDMQRLVAFLDFIVCDTMLIVNSLFQFCCDLLIMYRNGVEKHVFVDKSSVFVLFLCWMLLMFSERLKNVRLSMGEKQSDVSDGVGITRALPPAHFFLLECVCALIYPNMVDNP